MYDLRYKFTIQRLNLVNIYLGDILFLVFFKYPFLKEKCFSLKLFLIYSFKNFQYNPGSGFGPGSRYKLSQNSGPGYKFNVFGFWIHNTGHIYTYFRWDQRLFKSAGLAACIATAATKKN